MVDSGIYMQIQHAIDKTLKEHDFEIGHDPRLEIWENIGYDYDKAWSLNEVFLSFKMTYYQPCNYAECIAEFLERYFESRLPNIKSVYKRNSVYAGVSKTIYSFICADGKRIFTIRNAEIVEYEETLDLSYEYEEGIQETDELGSFLSEFTIRKVVE